ncbi:MAG: hypothetical protein P1U69_12955 [Parvibaculaceae bacterium]|nr:hypothetical protein [Parvibaculaceae bacterium]HBM89637.1 hypothetical protein [Rhodobiaceae bacterium]|tara:strand:+ start:679 stop:1062 length:384 start_codon:yes stop_codon:yes gene_type:complete
MPIDQIALIVAALGAVGIGLAHSILGEQGIVKPVLKRMNWNGVPPDADFLNSTVRFAWHITTFAWTGLAVILLAPLLGMESNPAFVPLTIAMTFAITGIVTLVASKGRHLAWIVFLGIAAGAAWPYL